MTAANPFHRVDAVLVDLDGTLLDTLPDIAAAVNEALAACGAAPLPIASIRRYVGRGVDVLLQRALGGGMDARLDPARLQAMREAFLPAYHASNGRATRPYPGVTEGLRALADAGIALGCVTNKPAALAAAVLAQFDLARFFPVLVGGDTLAVRKPDPAPLHRAAELLGLPLARCVMLGDSANDALAARAAGIPVALVDYGYTEGLPVAGIDCDLRVSSIADFARELLAGHWPAEAPA